MIMKLMVIALIGAVAMGLSACTGIPAQDMAAIASALSKDQSSVCVTATTAFPPFANSLTVVRVGQGGQAPVCK